MAIEIVSFPIQNGGSFHSYVSLPELVIPWSSLTLSFHYDHPHTSHAHAGEAPQLCWLAHEYIMNTLLHPP